MWSPVRFSPTGRARPTLTREQRGLEGALIEAGKTAEEIRRRTTCIVRRNDPGEARAYTRLGGELIAVANRAFRSEPDPILWSTGGLVPEFDHRTTRYTLPLPAATMQGAFTSYLDGLVNPTQATVRVGSFSTHGFNGRIVRNRERSQTFGLAAGHTTHIAIVVTAENGITRTISTVEVTRLIR